MRFLTLTLASLAAVIVAGTWTYWGHATPVTRPNAAPQILSPARIVLTRQQQSEARQLGGFSQTPLSLLRVDRRMEYGDFIWNDDKVPPGPPTIRVDLRTQVMSVFRGGHEIGIAVILFGADAKQTPLGTFPILWKGKNHRSSLYDAAMPYTLRLTGDGIAIHGSDVRWGAATHGCVGIPTEFARRLYGVAKVGDRVAIVRTAKGSKTASNGA